MNTARWRQWFWLVVFDLRQQRRERGTLALLAAVVVLALIALAQGASHRQGQAAASARAAAQQTAARSRAQVEATRYFANPGDPQYAGLRTFRTPFDIRGLAFREHVDFAVRPALPGAAFAIGQGDVLPALVRVRAESMESVRNAADIEHPSRLASGRFDLLFFVVYLWPLFLLAATLSVLTQEREARRLPSLALQGVTPGTLLIVQVLARSLAAALLLVGVVGVAALVTGAVPLSAGGLGAWAAWTAVVLAYTLFWAAVAALVCARAGNRTSAAFAGFGTWVAVAIVLPALLASAVSLAAPLPPREGYIVAMRDAADRVNANRLSLLARFYDEHPTWRSEKTAIDKLPSAVTRFARAIEVEKALAGVEADFERARSRQAELLGRWALLSPVTLAHGIFSALAGHDAERHRRFEAEVRSHQVRMRDFFQSRIQQAALAEEKNPCANATCIGGYGFTDFAALPRFKASVDLLEPRARTLSWVWLVTLAVALLALASKASSLSGRRAPLRAQPQ